MEQGSGNVYSDLGFENPGEMFAKAQLVSAIVGIIRAQKLTQKKAAEIMGLSQPDISKMIRGNFHHVTFDRLFKFLDALGCKTEIQILTPESKDSKILCVGVSGQ